MKDKLKAKVFIQYSALCVALIMIGIGIALEQPQQIFEQAIRICLECIGIG